MVTKSEVLRQFGKIKLQQIAKELGLTFDEGLHAYTLINLITTNLAEKGMPDVKSKDILKLLVTLGYYAYGPDGQLVVITPAEKNSENGSEKIEEATPKEKLPCWGAGDPDRDPGCRACSFHTDCYQERIRLRADIPCFGKAYDEQNDDCKGCLEWMDCKEKMV